LFRPPPHLYDIHPRKDHRGVDLISDALPFGRLWYGDPNAVSNAIGYAKFRSRLHHAAFSKRTGSTPGASRALQKHLAISPIPCRLLRLHKRIGLKSYLRLSAVL
jgi:hypothetical protein